MKKKTIRLVAGLALLIIVVSAAGWWYASDTNKDGRAGPETARVIKRDFSATVLATGAVKPQVGAEVKVGARISGKVERLYANIGDTVKKGQVIAELEKADLEAGLARYQAEVDVAEAKINDAKARMKLARREFQRQKNLLAKDLTSQRVVDTALKEKEVAEAALLLTQKQRNAAQAALREAQVRLSYATLTAPISGVVASVATQEGETVAAGLSAPTFVNIIDLQRLQVDAYVDEVDIGKIKVGQRATFTVDAYPAQEFEGKVVAIYPKAVIQENVVNYDVVIEITSPYQGLLMPEMTTSVTVFLEIRKDVLAIPVRAVKRERGKSMVYTLDNGQATARQIRTGWRDGSWIEVATGLNEGQTVLINVPSVREEK